MIPQRPKTSTNPSYLEATLDMLDKHSVRNVAIPRNMYDEVNAHNQEYDTVCGSYEYPRGIRDNWHVIHSLCTVKK